MNWNDPAARATLADELGPSAYSERLTAYLEASTSAVVNGYAIRPQLTRFGHLFAVAGTRVAFTTRHEAEAHASSLPPAIAAIDLALSTVDLTAIYEGYCRRLGLPLVSADEHDRTALPREQCQWLDAFITRWDAVQRIEDAAVAAPISAGPLGRRLNPTLSRR